MCQRKYIQKVLRHFRMKHAKVVGKPLVVSIHLSELNNSHNDEEKKSMTHVPIVSTLGSLMYVMMYTRQYLRQVVNLVTKYVGKEYSSKKDLEILKGDKTHLNKR